MKNIAVQVKKQSYLCSTHILNANWQRNTTQTDCFFPHLFQQRVSILCHSARWQPPYSGIRVSHSQKNFKKTFLHNKCICSIYEKSGDKTLQFSFNTHFEFQKADSSIFTRILKTYEKGFEDYTFVKVTGMLASSCIWSASSVNCCCCFCNVSSSLVISCLANTTLQSS